MTDVNREKSEIRKKMLAIRNQLSVSEVLQASAIIDQSLRKQYPLLQAENIMAFAAFDKEVNLDGWISWARQQGKNILLPRINKAQQDLEAVVFESWDFCQSGSFGIREPAGPTFDTALIQAVIVPGLAFDADGHRVGYGKGYYDRLLARLNTAAVYLCGVCYEFQIVTSIPVAPNDKPVHWIVTERSEIAVDMNFF